MSDHTITFQDVPPQEASLMRGKKSGRSLSPEVYEILQRLCSIQPGYALRMHITPPPSSSFRKVLWVACKTRWPGTQVIQRGPTMVIIPPQQRGPS